MARADINTRTAAYARGKFEFSGVVRLTYLTCALKKHIVKAGAFFSPVRLPRSGDVLEMDYKEMPETLRCWSADKFIRLALSLSTFKLKETDSGAPISLCGFIPAPNYIERYARGR